MSFWKSNMCIHENKRHLMLTTTLFRTTLTRMNTFYLLSIHGSCTRFSGFPIINEPRKSQYLFRLEKLFYVCHVCTQDQSFNNFENDTMKFWVNEANLTGLWARNFAIIRLFFNFKICLWTRKLPGLSRHGAPKSSCCFIQE